jgi:hypothetical protein
VRQRLDELDESWGVSTKTRIATQRVRDAVRKLDASLGVGATLRAKGLLKPISQGGILPLFGLYGANQLENCYEIPVAQKGFSPQLKHVFVDPFGNSSLNLASYNLLVTTESDVVVALYPLKQSLRDVSNFIIMKARKTDLVNYPRGSASLTRNLKVRAMSLQRTLACAEDRAVVGWAGERAGGRL